jgi:hypothetical protein
MILLEIPAMPKPAAILAKTIPIAVDIPTPIGPIISIIPRSLTT